MDIQNKCCGNCKNFKNEDVEGFGLCEYYDDVVHCSQIRFCIEKYKGWAEITPDNVDELYNINEELLMIAFKLGDKMYYQHKSLMRATLNTLAKSEGYYYYVLPELKIDGAE